MLCFEQQSKIINVKSQQMLSKYQLLLHAVTCQYYYTHQTVKGSHLMWGETREGLGEYEKENGNKKTLETKEDIQMADKHIKKCPTTNVVTEL